MEDNPKPVQQELAVNDKPDEDSSKPRQNEPQTVSSGADKKSIFSLITDAFGKKTAEATLRDELEVIISEHEESGEATPEENIIIRNVLNFSDVKVCEVMTPRPDINSVSLDMELSVLIGHLTQSEHTRLPVYRDNMDDIVGFLHIKDLLKYWGDGANFKISDILREIIFIPPSMKITTLLEKMKLARTHMAIVIDEYGGTDGLVTIEDLMEEIVGEIEDEHDDETEVLIQEVGEGVYEVSARLEIEELEDQLNKQLREEGEDFDTVGGLIFNHMGKVPEVGEVLEHSSGVNFEVLEADNRKVERVKVSV